MLYSNSFCIKILTSYEQLYRKQNHKQLKKNTLLGTGLKEIAADYFAN